MQDRGREWSGGGELNVEGREWKEEEKNKRTTS